MRNKTSLHKFIVALISVAYGIVLVLLLLLEAYANVNYRRTLQNAWQSSLLEYANNVEQTMESVNSNMFEIWSYDQNFEALRTAEGLESLGDSYQLMERLQTLEVFENKGISYVLYYDQMQQRKYYFDPNSYRNADIEAIKPQLDAMVATYDTMNTWWFTSINGKEYAISIYRSDGVAICEICNLAEFRDELESAVDHAGAQVFYYYRGDLLARDEEVAAYQGLNLQQDTVYNNSYVLKKRIGNMDLWMVLCIPATFDTFMNVQQVVLILLIISSFLLIRILYKRMRRELLQPLRQMITEMNVIGAGEMESRITTTSNFEELQQTIDTINLMVDEISRQKLISYEQSVEKQQAQMQYLTLQLKPHFYLNGLKTLNVLAMKGETEKIQDIILKLSEYLRTMLQVEQEEVLLESEIACVRNYAELQSITLERGIHIDWQVEVERSDWIVPNLCLQTFVENSIKYAGRGMKGRELMIFIQIHELRTEEGLYLDVYIRDNGDGFPEDVLEIINADSGQYERCVGINNFKRRCGILYGEGFEYTFGNAPGATVSYILPWKSREKEIELA